jgi:hypothetical protein
MFHFKVFLQFIFLIFSLYSFAQDNEHLMPSDSMNFPIDPVSYKKLCNSSKDSNVYIYVFYDDQVKNNSEKFLFYKNFLYDRYNLFSNIKIINNCFFSLCPKTYAAHTICGDEIGVLTKDDLQVLSFFIDKENLYWRKYIQTPIYNKSQSNFFYTKYIDGGVKKPSKYLKTDNLFAVSKFLDFVEEEKSMSVYPVIKNDVGLDSIRLSSLIRAQKDNYGSVGIKIPVINSLVFRNGSRNSFDNLFYYSNESTGGIFSGYYLFPENHGRDRKHELEAGFFWLSNSSVSEVHLSNTSFRGLHLGYLYRFNFENQLEGTKSSDFNVYCGMGGFCQFGNFDQSNLSFQVYQFSRSFYKDIGFSPTLGIEYNKKNEVYRRPSRLNFSIEAKVYYGLLSVDNNYESQNRLQLFSLNFRTDYKVSKL